MRACSALIVFSAACILASPAIAADVCRYAVAQASGVGCRLHAGDRVCLTASTTTGACDAPLRCIGGFGLSCNVALTPKSGLLKQCPFGSTRLVGFRCARRPAARTATPSPSPTPRPTSLVVFNAQLEDLDAYDALDGDRKQVVVSGNEDESDPEIPALNGQICFFPDGSRKMVLGDDAGQPNPPPGWSILQLSGTRVGEFSVTRVARLIPTYQPGQDGAENIGCGFLKDGRLLTTDVGNQVTGEGSGQLIVWFPPFGLSNNRYCKLDTTIATAGGLAVDDQERIYVASARGQSVYRYTGPFPTGPDAAGGCGGRDATGAPLADHVNRETFINDPGHTVTPTSVILSGHGTFFVASVLTGVIAEYDANGAFLRVILQPPPGEDLADLPYSTGTPFGLGTDSTGTLYYADLGLVASNGDIGPGDGTGTVRRIRFQNGNPLPPETIDSGLSFPDGIGVLEE
jgi:hypothetical protein